MKQQTATDIINAAAVECGLLPSSGDPFASGEEHFKQMTWLLNNMGAELQLYHDWQELTQKHTIVTKSGDSGQYPLPAGFSHMIPQTGWDETNRWPIEGPLSEQEWAWLEGRKLNQQTIRVTFRLRQGEFQIYPSPPPEGVTLSFSYQSNHWVQGATGTKDRAETGSDLVLFPGLPCIYFLKYKYLAAKGFDTTAAAAELQRSLESTMGKDTSARILNTGGLRYGYPYLNPHRNIADTGYGHDVW